MIRLDLSEQQTDYVYRLLMARPMGEVETLVNLIRRQVQTQDQAEDDGIAFGAKPNGGASDDLPALP